MKWATLVSLATVQPCHEPASPAQEGNLGILGVSVEVGNWAVGELGNEAQTEGTSLAAHGA